MPTRFLKPSTIAFSRSHIQAYFTSPNVPIGYTLDQIAAGSLSLKRLPRLCVVYIQGRCVTYNNKLLWIHRHLERLGYTTTVQVEENYQGPLNRFYADAVVTGNPGGEMWMQQPNTDNWGTVSLVIGIVCLAAFVIFKFL